MVCTLTPVILRFVGKAWCTQLIYAGKTSRVVPEQVRDKIFLDHTDNHWQSVGTLLRFINWIDDKVNVNSAEQPWAHCARCSSGDSLPTCLGSSCASSTQEPQASASPWTATSCASSNIQCSSSAQGLAAKGLLFWKGFGTVAPELAPAKLFKTFGLVV
eukprot:2930364-Amphidinium_carterae.1